MRFITSLLIISSFLFSTGCEFKKTAAKVVANTTAPIIATTLSCKNQTAVKEDLQKKLEQWFKVNEKEARAQAKADFLSPLCVAAVSAVLPLLIDFTAHQLPEKWECDASLLGNSAYELAVKACGTLKDSDIQKYVE